MIDAFLQVTIDNEATDLHLTVGRPPMLRVAGDLVKMETEPLTSENMDTMLRHVLPPWLEGNLQNKGVADFSYSFQGNRFRISAFRRQGQLAMAMRLLPEHLLSIDELGIPANIREIISQNYGLFLVSGPTGSGKTTTLATLINFLSHTKASHILTVEDPIEFIHTARLGIISQREIGPDVPSFADGLRQSLRQDPDIIMVGEMRDLETTRVAIAASETGHLVLSTSHANTASATVSRLISQYPQEEQPFLRARVADALLGVISQRLVPRADRTGLARVALMEICYTTPAIKSLIKQGKEMMIADEIVKGRHLGMRALNDHIDELLAAGVISSQTAQANRVMRDI